MATRAARFTQADISRAMKGAAKAGVSVAVEIGIDGAIRLIPVEARPAPVSADRIMQRVQGFK
jgi:hypothetical protein